MRRSGDRFIPVHKLRLGDRARFVVGWKVNEWSSHGVTGKLAILKGNQVLYRREMHGRSGAIGGTLHAEVHLVAGDAVGRLTARFTVRLGRTAERTIHFTVLPPSA